MDMPRQAHLACLPFQLAGRLFAVPLELVLRVERMVAVTPLPGAPKTVLGVIAVGGRHFPVVDPRPRFGMPPVAEHPSQQLIFLATAARTMAMRVDGTKEVFYWETPGAQTADLRRPEPPWPGVDLVAGVLQVGEEVLLLHDPERFFLPEEEAALDAALQSFLEKAATSLVDDSSLHAAPSAEGNASPPFSKPHAHDSDDREKQ